MGVPESQCPFKEICSCLPSTLSPCCDAPKLHKEQGSICTYGPDATIYLAFAGKALLSPGDGVPY